MGRARRWSRPHRASGHRAFGVVRCGLVTVNAQFTRRSSPTAAAVDVGHAALSWPGCGRLHSGLLYGCAPSRPSRRSTERDHCGWWSPTRHPDGRSDGPWREARISGGWSLRANLYLTQFEPSPKMGAHVEQGSDRAGHGRSGPEGLRFGTAHGGIGAAWPWPASLRCCTFPPALIRGEAVADRRP